MMEGRDALGRFKRAMRSSAAFRLMPYFFLLKGQASDIKGEPLVGSGTTHRLILGMPI